MKLIVSLSLIWMLSSSDGALQCANNTNIECKPSDYCVTAAMKGGDRLKHCGSTSLCKHVNQTFSFNFGNRSLSVFVHCCKENICNVTYSEVEKPSTLKCFTCNGASVCNKTINCEGVQKRCLSGRVTNGGKEKKVYGCASENVCKYASELNFLHNWAEDLNFTSGVKCCETDMCNSAWTVKVNVVLVLLGLIMLTVW